MSFESNHPSRASVRLGLDLSKGDDEEIKRQRSDQVLLNDLLDQGYSPDAASYLVKKRNQTGDLDLSLPSFSNAVVPGTQPNRPVPLPPVPDIPERSTLQNFGPMRTKGILPIDENNPPATKDDILKSLIPVPDNFTSVTPVTMNRKSTGEDIYVDAKTGQEVRREANGSRQNRVVKVGSTTNGTAGSTTPKMTPEQQAAMSYMKDYYKAFQNGTADPNDPILPGAAKTLGMDVTELPSIENPTPSPTFIQSVFGIKPETPPPTPGKTIPTFKASKNGTNQPVPDLNQKASDFLTQHGQKATPANIKHAIDQGWVK